jgi:hypothetical protein
MSALIGLVVYQLGSAAAVMVDVAVQLTKLKKLVLFDLPHDNLGDPTLLPFTALTSLEELRLQEAWRPLQDWHHFFNEVSRDALYEVASIVVT